MESIPFNSNLLAERFRPIFIFDKQEQYFPCSVNYLINNSQLYNGEELVTDFGKTSVEDLSDNKGDRLIFAKESYNGDLQNAPVYYNIRVCEQFIDIVYILFFAYNGPLNVLGLFEVGEHTGDIEHVIVRLNKSNLSLNSVYFSAHNDEGEWVDKSNVKTIQLRNDENVFEHPMVYVARNSHAMYASEGTHYRIFGIVNDHCSTYKGSMLNDLIEVKECDKNETHWIHYNGSFDGVSCLPHRDWWTESPVYDSSVLTRLFPWYFIYQQFRKVHRF